MPGSPLAPHLAPSSFVLCVHGRNVLQAHRAETAEDFVAHGLDDLHPVSIDRLLEPVDPMKPTRPSIEVDGTALVGVLVAATCLDNDSTNKDDVRFREVDFVLNAERLLVVTKPGQPWGPLPMPSTLRTCQLDGTSPAMAAYHLVDDVADSYLALIDGLRSEIDQVEAMVDEDALKAQECIKALRRDLLQVRTTLSPLRDAVRRVVEDKTEVEGAQLIPPDVEKHFANAKQKFDEASEQLDLLRDLLNSARDYHQGKVAYDQNEVMERLTLVASILLVPALIVGFYGQNFDRMPELHWGIGYAWSIILIIGSTAGQLVFFKKKGWI